MKNCSRRDFLKTSTVAGAGFMVAAGNYKKIARASALQSVAVAGVGVGGKGGGDIQQAGIYGKVVALCDVDKNTLDSMGANFPDAKKYADFREMFAEMGDKFDALTCSTPDQYAYRRYRDGAEGEEALLHPKAVDPDDRGSPLSGEFGDRGGRLHPDGEPRE